jgi:hypothetical protein
VKPPELPQLPSRPTGFDDRFRLYMDESGDHVFRETTLISHRFLCLLGCWFRNPDYLRFHASLEELKTHYLPHHPDDPVILHRDDMINARKAFKALRVPDKRAAFDQDLLEVIQSADFKVMAVVIDKALMREKYREAAGHPYHIGLGFLLQRYAGYLNHINRVGDVLAEARGGEEDLLLKESYSRVYDRGIWDITSANTFQSALTSRELKLKSKPANIAGLQLADLLGHPTKMWVLKEYGLYTEPLAPFCEKIMPIVETKFNRQLYQDIVEGYGYLLYPRK